MYLTFAEYQTMGGTITDETVYNDFYWQAQAIIDWFTFNRLQDDSTFSESVKRCVFQLIKLVVQKSNLLGTNIDSSGETSLTGQITSQSNDGVSVSYNVPSASELLASSKQDMEDCVKMYLQGATNELGRKLLYRVVYENE